MGKSAFIYELNANGVYGAWHDDNAENKVYNLRHIIEDVTELKRIFKTAEENQDFIISIVTSLKYT